MAKETFKEHVNEDGNPGFIVRGEFYTGYSPDELAKKLGIADYEIVLLPQKTQRRSGARKLPGADDDHFGIS